MGGRMGGSRKLVYSPGMLNSFKDALITLKWGGNTYVSVNREGNVLPFNVNFNNQWAPQKLWSNITVEKCPAAKECVILKSIHGKYMRVVQRGGYYLAEFRETNYMNATPVTAVSPEGKENTVAFMIKEAGVTNWVRWFAEIQWSETLSWTLTIGDIYNAFSAPSGTKYIAYDSFHQVSLREVSLSYECTFKVERLGNGKVYLKAYFGGYLGLDQTSGKIKLYRDVRDYYDLSKYPHLVFRYVMIDNNHVALGASNSRFVKQDGDGLKASGELIEGGCIFTVTEFSAGKSGP